MLDTLDSSEGMMARQKRGVVFPLVEAFGYCVNATSGEALEARLHQLCPFAGNQCEKFRQYKYGYCSVTYSARDDDQERQRYAVCDHRLDGPPIQKVLADHFDGVTPELIPEIKLHELRTSIDYVAISRDESGNINDAIAIETQAIDLRGGGVGPAWNAWMDGKPSEWRDYFTREAQRKGRKDTVAYGVNMANITKRLGLQITVKGAYLKGIGVPLYVVMQDLPFLYLHRRIPFASVGDEEEADITFVTFEYGDGVTAEGSLEFGHKRTVRTTLAAFSSALSQGNSDAVAQRAEFLEAVVKKAKGIPHRDDVSEW